MPTIRDLDQTFTLKGTDAIVLQREGAGAGTYFVEANMLSNGAIGPEGPVGDTGATGVGIANTFISNGYLNVIYTNSAVANVGFVEGAIGPTGVGVANGGLIGQALTKKSNADFDSNWTNVVTSVSIANSPNLAVTGGPITSSGAFAMDLSNTGVSAGTYEKVTVDPKGRVTAGSQLVNGDVTAALGFTPLQHNEITTISGDATGSGSNAIAITLQATGVTAGTYTSPRITVDSKGRITSAANGAATTNGTVTSVSIANSTDITSTGSPITSSGSIAIGLSNTGVAAGAYTLTNITVDSRGRITSASNGTAGGTGTVTSVAISNSVDITSTGSPITSSGTIAIGLSNTGVTPGTYLLSTVAVDSKGRITSIQNGAAGGAGTVTSVSVTGDSAILSSGGPITNTGTIALKLSNTGVSAGTYTKVAVDVQGRVTASSALASTDVTTALGFTPLQHNETITVIGDVTGSGANSIILTLTNSGVTAGTYEKVTVNAKGRVTAGAQLANTDINTALGYTPLQHNETITVTGDVTGSGASAIATTLSNTGVTAGAYHTANVVVDSKGRITSISNGVAGGGGSGTVTSVGLTGSSAITVTGTSPITTSGTFSIDLLTTGVSAGTYTSANITVDSKGRITAASNGSSSGIPSGTGTDSLLIGNNTSAVEEGAVALGVYGNSRAAGAIAGPYARAVNEGSLILNAAPHNTVAQGLQTAAVQRFQFEECFLTYSGDSSASGYLSQNDQASRGFGVMIMPQDGTAAVAGLFDYVLVATYKNGSSPNSLVYKGTGFFECSYGQNVYKLGYNEEIGVLTTFVNGTSAPSDASQAFTYTMTLESDGATDDSGSSVPGITVQVSDHTGNYRWLAHFTIRKARGQ